MSRGREDDADSERPRPDDSCKLAPPIGPPLRDENADRLALALRLMHWTDERAQHRYDEAVRGLTRDASAVAAAAEQWIEAAAEDPMLRWALLFVIADMRDALCLKLLRRQALRRAPQRVRREGVCEQAADFEEMVVVMAIAGLGALAEDGVGDAVDALLEVVAGQDRRSLRRPAAAALVAVSPQQRQRVCDTLPAEDRYVLDLRIATEEDLSVPVTEADLRRNPNRRLVPAKPRLQERPPRAPKASERQG